MEKSIEKALELLSDTQNGEKLGMIISSLTKNDSKPEHAELSEKAEKIQRKIDMLSSISTLLDRDYAKRIEQLIKVLNIAKLITELRETL